MVKKKQEVNKFALIALLVVVPIVVMWLLGFGNYNADEFSIISVAVLADISVYLGYKLLLPKFFR